jgi:hypothetical protein
MKQITLIAIFLGIAVVGCGSADTSVTKEQEHAFRNPPKNMPAEAAQSMAQGAAEARKKQEEDAQKKAAQNPPAGNTK